jgi:hypothetical protein
VHRQGKLSEGKLCELDGNTGKTAKTSSFEPKLGRNFSAKQKSDREIQNSANQEGRKLLYTQQRDFVPV